MTTNELYQDLSTSYGGAIDGVNLMISYLYAGLISVIEIDDPDVKMELLQTFRSVYDTANESSISSFFPAIISLNNHILNNTQYLTIDAYLSGEGLTVTQSWADANSSIGHPISLGNIS